ncbi:hypothetical protein HOY82DRAFT_619134 [Tuber indicum]|nr:hypothetical protein HOY82DRAFT_619134 [Tuber indicum]
MRGALTEKNKDQPRKLYDLMIATDSSRVALLMIERGTPMGFKDITYARSIILKDCIKDVGEVFQSLPTTNAHAAANSSIEKVSGTIIATCKNHEQCPMFVSGPTDDTQRKDYCSFSQRYGDPDYPQRLMEESSKNHEDLEYSFVGFRRGVDHPPDTKNKIRRTIDEFGITPGNANPTRQFRAHIQRRNSAITVQPSHASSFRPSNAAGISFSTRALRQAPSSAGLSLKASENRSSET